MIGDDILKFMHSFKLNPVHTVILASGISRRFAACNKLLLPCPDRTALAEQTMRAVAGAFSPEDGIRNDAQTPADSEKTADTGTDERVRAVFGKKILIYSDDRVGELAARHGFTVIKNDDYAEGKAAGIRLAVQHAPEGNLLFLAGDQYGVRPDLLAGLAAAIQEGQDAGFSKTQRGFGLPAVFAAHMRPCLARLTGEQGGRDALKLLEEERGPARVVFVPATAEQCADIDTWNEYLHFLASGGIRNLFVTGARGAGKSTLVRKAAAATDFFDGIRTILDRTQSSAENFLYVERIRTGDKMLAARLLKETKKLTHFFPEAFNVFAVAQLKNAVADITAGGLTAEKRAFLIIDELGRLESDCADFHDYIRNLAAGISDGLTLIAVLQDGNIPFNDELKNRTDSIVLNACATRKQELPTAFFPVQ